MNYSESGKQSSISPLSATVVDLKSFLAKNKLPITGKKGELVDRVWNFEETESLKDVIEAGDS